MKALHRVSLLLGLLAASATSVQAATPRGPGAASRPSEVYLSNNFLEDVRVFAEDAGGRLHDLGRVNRGAFHIFEIPAALTGSEFRVKVYPISGVWSPISDDYGVKTEELVTALDRQVHVWLKPNLAASVVEIDRN